MVENRSLSLFHETEVRGRYQNKLLPKPPLRCRVSPCLICFLFPRLSTGGAGQPDAGGRQHRVRSSQSHNAPRLLSRPHHLPHPQTPENEQV